MQAAAGCLMCLMHLGRVQRQRLANDATPALIEGLLHDLVVGAWGPAANDKGVGHLHAIDNHRQVRALRDRPIDQVDSGVGQAACPIAAILAC